MKSLADLKFCIMKTVDPVSVSVYSNSGMFLEIRGKITVEGLDGELSILVAVFSITCIRLDNIR